MTDDINDRLHSIILMCQKAKKKYGFDYEKKYKTKISKFTKEIIDDNLIDKSHDKTWAKQLCWQNCLYGV